MLPNRRDFLLAAAATASAGAVWSARRLGAQAQEAPPETTTVRLAKTPSLCVMPQYVVDELLAAEGITQVDYVVSDSGPLLSEAIASGQIDFALHFSGPLVLLLDRGRKVTMLAGVHVGCFELFAKDDIRSIADLKGRSVGISALESSPHVFVSAMAALVGLDPAKDINWVTSAEPKPIELFLDGKVDAFLGFPPEPQRLRAQGVSHVIVNSAQDRPWSQYFCCMLAGNPEFVRTKPIAAKRVVRAMLRATDLCLSAADQGRTASRGPRLYAELRVCGPDALGRALRQVARLRSRGHDPLLRAAPARSRNDQVESGQDYRRRRRLAIVARSEARARVIP